MFVNSIYVYIFFSFVFTPVARKDLFPKMGERKQAKSAVEPEKERPTYVPTIQATNCCHYASPFRATTRQKVPYIVAAPTLTTMLRQWDLERTQRKDHMRKWISSSKRAFTILPL